MSLDLGVGANGEMSFPRVSGDEPLSLPGHERAAQFSPRERG